MSEENDVFEGENEMSWEVHARRAIRSAAENIDLDEVRGVVYMDSGTDHRFNTVTEEFTSAEDIRLRLTQIGEDEWIAHVPFDEGEVVFEPDVESMTEDVLEEHKIEAFFESVAPPSEGEEIVNARDMSPPRAGLAVQLDVIDINAELIRYLAVHPEKMREMNPRKFEELVAELFKDKGYEVELTPRTRDGGLDIRACMRSDVGTCLTLIECKRYGQKKLVSVDIVRGLYGVTESSRATMGIIATTSHFTSDAKSFQAQNQYRLHLADFDHVKEWLTAYKRGGT
jgi:restriction endonuclease Mrr